MLAAGYLEDQAVERSGYTPGSMLSDGTAVTVRPVQQSDVVLIQAMHMRLSRQTIYYRYFGPRTPTPEELERLCFLDGRPGLAIVATVHEPRQRVIAMACYAVNPDDPGTAEVGILVEDSYQGRGLGRHIFAALCQQARQRGLERFECITNPSNHRMLHLIEGAGLRHESRFCQGVRAIQVRL